jgi:hypothetical protein
MFSVLAFLGHTTNKQQKQCKALAGTSVIMVVFSIVNSATLILYFIFIYFFDAPAA